MRRFLDNANGFYKCSAALTESPHDLATDNPGFPGFEAHGVDNYDVPVPCEGINGDGRCAALQFQCQFGRRDMFRAKCLLNRWHGTLIAFPRDPGIHATQVRGNGFARCQPAGMAGGIAFGNKQLQRHEKANDFFLASLVIAVSIAGAKPGGQGVSGRGCAVAHELSG